jgi:hypothetical protein
MFVRKAVNIVEALFHVWARVKAGELEVSVPLFADSVVNSPVFGVVEPMAGGLARSTLLPPPPKKPIN